MSSGQRHYEYPAQAFEVLEFSNFSASLFPAPPGLIADWPPTQVQYLQLYLQRLNCKTIVVESHYVDRDYIHDLAFFHARSLRNYHNYCRRVHFFNAAFDQPRWNELLRSAGRDGGRSATQILQGSYLGFVVLRPLPATPVGRTVVPTLGPRSASGSVRQFGAVREYEVHVAGISLAVHGLAFQQQDQGVSACATTALWSAIHKVAALESLTIPTPAQITEAASRYLLADGRSLPSEGLTLNQICEAIRASGLSPLVIRSVSMAHDRAQLFSYLSSGLAPVLAIRPIQADAREGHAICGVGVKLGDPLPPTDPNVHHWDAASAVTGAFVHDDRLGPYALADLYPHTADGKIRTALRIQWPDKVDAEHSLVTALIVPVPTKLRLTVTRMRELGFALAEAAALIFKSRTKITLQCRYQRGYAYQQSALQFGLTEDGLYRLLCESALSRFVGVIEITSAEGELFDVVLDTTETRANPSVLFVVCRKGLPDGGAAKLRHFASKLGGGLIA